MIEGERIAAGAAVHATGEPGALHAAQAGVASIDHASQLSDETVRIMKEKHIPAVPIFTVFDYFLNQSVGAVELPPYGVWVAAVE